LTFGVGIYGPAIIRAAGGGLVHARIELADVERPDYTLANMVDGDDHCDGN
jgi:hypothetical protein